jgi:hypothetical protein
MKKLIDYMKSRNDESNFFKKDPSFNFPAQKQLLGFWIVLPLILFQFSCEKVINIDLNNAAKRYVIEGWITNRPGDCEIRITQTVNFSDPNVFAGVTDAIVTIQDNNNPPVLLSQSVDGLYQTGQVNGAPGHTYTLMVKVGGQLFSAKSIMPEQVNFDSLYIAAFQGFGATKKFADVVFTDPPGKGNAYRFVQVKNNQTNNGIFVLNDNFTDGRVNNSLLAYFDSKDENMIKTGDTVSVEMMCIDPAIYKYWFGLQESSTGNSNNASPGNPVSNISGGALGYFSAHTFQIRSVISP